MNLCNLVFFSVENNSSNSNYYESSYNNYEFNNSSKEYLFKVFNLLDNVYTIKSYKNLLNHKYIVYIMK